MKRILLTSLAGLGLGLAATTAQALPSLALGATAGTLGAGAQATVELLPVLNARASVQGLGINPGYKRDGVDYDGRLRLLSYGGYLDLYPLTRWLRLSAGVVGNQNRLDLSASCPTRCQVGSATVGNTTPGNDGTVFGRLGFRDAAPYLGFGFSNPMAGLPFYIGADFGVLFQGRPRARLDASGTSTVDFNDGNGPRQVDLGSNAQFRSQLATEQGNLQRASRNYRYYPVAQLNLGWRF